MLCQIYENINTVIYISCYIIQPKIIENKNVFGTNLPVITIKNKFKRDVKVIKRIIVFVFSVINISRRVSLFSMR